MLQKNNSLFNESAFRIAKLLFNHPTSSFHIRKIARETGLSTTAVLQSVERLSKEGIVTVEKTEITTNIKANLDSKNYYAHKKMLNIFFLTDYLNEYNVPEKIAAEAIVLFGSYSKGEDVEESDIDLLVITNISPKDFSLPRRKTCEKELNRKINLNILPSLDKSSAEFKNAIANGVVLYGYVKVG